MEKQSDEIRTLTTDVKNKNTEVRIYFRRIDIKLLLQVLCCDHFSLKELLCRTVIKSYQWFGLVSDKLPH